MHWYNYIACFFAGTILANAVPHFVRGISGDRFPTPFARRGNGLSSPTLNVVWALVNLILGYLLFRFGKVSSGGNLALIGFFAGIAALSIWLSALFTHLNRNQLMKPSEPGKVTARTLSRTRDHQSPQ
jgi:hypothetical protein